MKKLMVVPSALCLVLCAGVAIVGMPFAYSVSEGIMWGIISYTLVNLIAGKARKIHWIMYVLTALFIAKYALM